MYRQRTDGKGVEGRKLPRIVPYIFLPAWLILYYKDGLLSRPIIVCEWLPNYPEPEDDKAARTGPGILIRGTVTP